MAENTGKQVVDVEFKATGLGKLKSSWMDFAGELLQPMAILAAGGTKTQALWSGMQGIFATKVLGPLGAVLGAAAGFLVVTRNLVKEWRTVGVQSAKAIETLTLQFKPLLGSLELAKKRAREVFAFSVKSPFKFEELAEGNKILEGLTRGALSTKAGMELVGDAAAVAGGDFAGTARNVGRLYDGLMSGRPVGEAAMRLQELGLITGQTRNAIDSMQASNAAGSEIWRVVEQDLQRTKGAMSDLSESVEGLESTYADTRNSLSAGFGQGFLEGEKAGIKSAIVVMERLTPAAKQLGDEISLVENWFAKLKARVVDAATGFPGFTTVVTGAWYATVGLAGAIVVAGAAMVGKFLAGVLSAATATRQLAAASVTATQAQVVQQAVTVGLTAAKKALATAIAAVRAGNYLQAASELRLAAATAIAAVRTNALAASQGLLRGAMMLTFTAMRFVTMQVIQLGAAILKNPIFRLVAVLIIAGEALLHYANKNKQAREEQEAFDKATRATGVNLERMRRNIETVTDLRRAEAAALDEVAKAHVELQKVQAGEGDVTREQAQNRLNMAQRGLRAIRAVPKASLNKTDEQVAMEDRIREGAKAAKKSREEAVAESGPSSEYGQAKTEYDRGLYRAGVAMKAMEQEAALAAEQERMQREINDATAGREALVAKKAALEKKIAEYDKADAETPDFGLNQALSKPSRAKLEEVNAQLAALNAKELAGSVEKSGVALNSDSELARLKEQVKIYDERKAAINAEADAQTALNDAKDEEKVAAAAALDLAKQRAEVMSKLASKAGIGEGFNREAANHEIGIKQTERDAAIDPGKREEELQRLEAAELKMIQARLDGESQVAALRLKGYEREKMMLDFEMKKLDAARARGKLDEDAYNRQKAVLDAQQEALDKSGREKGQELAMALEISRLSREEGNARRDGDTGKADKLRAEAERLEMVRVKRDAEKEAAEVAATPEERKTFVDNAVGEEAKRRKEEREREAQERESGRARSRAEQATAAAEIKARVLEQQGKSKEARKVKEDDARKQDELARRDKRKAYREEGFSGKEADAMANKDVKTAQMNRMMEEMMGGKGNVIASSLARVGGGGNVSGSDPQVKLQERMVKLLEQLNDTAKENIDTMR